MKTLLLTFLLAVIGVVADTRADEPPISVSIAIPKRYGERRIPHLDRTSHFHVIVTNTSDKPQRIWQEWCSSGYYGLTFEFTDERGKKGVAKKKVIDLVRDNAEWQTLEPHEFLIFDVYFGNSDIWEGFPIPEQGEQPVTMKAVFEFKPDDASARCGVWNGRAVSKAEKFVVYSKQETK